MVVVAVVELLLTVCELEDVLALVVVVLVATADVVDDATVGLTTDEENTLALAALGSAAETAVCTAAVVCEAVMVAVVLAVVLASV